MFIYYTFDMGTMRNQSRDKVAEIFVKMYNLCDSFTISLSLNSV